MEDYEKFNPEAPRVKTALARLYMYRWPFSLASESQERAGKPVIKRVAPQLWRPERGHGLAHIRPVTKNIR